MRLRHSRGCGADLLAEAAFFVGDLGRVERYRIELEARVGGHTELRPALAMSDQQLVSYALAVLAPHSADQAVEPEEAEVLDR